MKTLNPMNRNESLESYWQAWQTYKHKALQAPSFTDDELERIFKECQQQPALPAPPFPSPRHHGAGVRLAAVIVLIVVATTLLLLLRGNPVHDDSMQADLSVPSVPAVPPPSVASGTTLTESVPYTVPRHVTVAKAEIKADKPSSSGNPLPEPATPQPVASTDTTEHIHFILSPDNVQYASLSCNSETCDSQYYITQILNNLLS